MSKENGGDRVYGYARVSSMDQNEDRQVMALKEYGVPGKNIYVDKVSGRDFERPKYRKMIGKLKKGDMLVTLSIDRFGRDYEEILNQWRIITKDIGADILILDMPLLDTRTGKDLMGTFIADLVLQILSFVAQTEKDNIKKRQQEGIAAAKARGVKFGRPPRPLPENFTQIVSAWNNKEISLYEAAIACGFPAGTFYEKARKMVASEYDDK